MMKTKKINRVIAFLALMTVTLLIAGCAGNNGDSSASLDKKESQTTDGSSDQLRKTGLPEQGAGNQTKETMKITIYHASQDALYLVPEVHIVPKQPHYAAASLELLLAGTMNKDLVAVLPQGTKLHGVTIKNHIAYPDFTEALIKNNGGGSAAEQLIVGAIVNTLTEFPDIQKVQILVEGKKVGTISGHVDTSEPLSRFGRLIKKSS